MSADAVLSDPTSILLRFQTDFEYQDVRVYWGTAYGVYPSSSAILSAIEIDADGAALYEYRILNLAPGTHYFYKVHYGTKDFESNFYAKPASSQVETRFNAMAEGRGSSGATVGKVLTALDAWIAGDPTHRSAILFNSDLSTGGAEAAVQDEWFSQVGHACKYPTVIARGSQELNPAVYKKYWPNNTDKDYFSFDYGCVHFIVFSQYYQSWGWVTPSPGDPLYAWISEDLDATTQPIKIAVFTNPGWSADGFSSSANEDIPGTQSMILNLLNAKGVKLCLVGHNSYFSRAKPPGCSLEVLNIGIGGNAAAPYPDLAYNPEALTPPALIFAARTYGWVSITANKTSGVVHAQIYTVSGELFEEFDVGTRPAHSIMVPLNGCASEYVVGGGNEDLNPGFYIGLGNSFNVYGNPALLTGFRFLVPSIPNAANITKAYIIFQSHNDLAGAPDALAVSVDDVANSSVFTGAGSELTTRTKFGAIAWTPTEWVTGALYRPADITALIQRAVNKGGWVAGNALSIFFNNAVGPGGTPRLVHNSIYQQRAYLYVEWS